MHGIQDVILTVGALVFIVALLPTMFGREKPALTTSITTGTVLVVFSGVYVSLGLWFSAATTLVTACCWFTLAAQKYFGQKQADS